MSSGQSDSILVPISLGELVDKITILEIKTAHLHGNKLVHTQTELDALNKTFRSIKRPIEQSLIESLRRVNKSLWTIEDNIRDHERNENFGPGFIALARSVYQQNDKRAAIKKEINLRYGSKLIEEKSYASY